MTPNISVVVPTYGRPGRLSACLESLACQSLSTDAFEVIVLDDGSPAGRRPHAGTLRARNQRLRRQLNAGPAAARNAGAATARGRLLAFIDDDCLADPDWLVALERAHALEPDALLGGLTVNGATDHPCSEVAESLLQFFDEQARRRGVPPEFFASNNIAMARERFDALGGFDERFPLAAGEDRDFCHRWLAAGGRLSRAHAARVVHCHTLDLRGFWRQQCNYGRGAWRFRAAGDRSAPRSWQSPGFYVALVFHPLRRERWRWPRRLGGVALTALSQCAVATGLWQERRRERTEHRR